MKNMRFVRLLLVLLPNLNFSIQGSPTKCGSQKVHTKVLIMHGLDAYAGQFPWHAALYHWNGRNQSYACGGSLISEVYVLTAAHCTKDVNGYEKNRRRLTVYLGLYELNVVNTAMVQQHSVLSVHKVSGDRWAELRNDIALLELGGQVKFTDYVQPICLVASAVPAGTVGMTAGWGHTEDEDLAQRLQRSSMPIVEVIECLASDRATFGPTLDRGMICAGHQNGTTVCKGDSGGGLIVELEAGSWFLVGIVSFAAQSAQGSSCSGFGVFVKVHEYLPWIKNITENAINDGNCGLKRIKLAPFWTKQSEFADWPWHGTLHRKSGLTKFCGVTVLTDKFSVTSNKCIADHSLNRKPNELYVLVGNYDSGKNAQERNVVEMRSSSVDYTSVILIELELPLFFSDYVQPICLWQNRMNKTGNIVGYGGEDQNRRRLLGEDRMTVSPKTNCYIQPDNLQLLCVNLTSENMTFTNKWDAGGGLFIPDSSNKWYLRGIFHSYPSKSKHQENVVLLDIVFYLEWIKSIIQI